jgi:hypothetical protein
MPLDMVGKLLGSRLAGEGWRPLGKAAAVGGHDLSAATKAGPRGDRLPVVGIGS